MKRVFSLLLVLFLAVALLPVNAEAATVAEGTCGENLTWTLDDAGTLTISGIGNIDVSPNFGDKEKIVRVVIHEGVTGIGTCAFINCTSLRSVTIPDSVTGIDDGAFQGCYNLTSITIPDSVTYIGAGTFSGCSGLTSINIPEGISIIRDNTFSRCSNLTSITIPDGVVRIDDFAFYRCNNLTSISIPESLTDTGYGVFSGCSSLTSITIPDNMTRINLAVFSDCTSLANIIIPEGITEVGEAAFVGCTGLKYIIFSGNAPFIAGDAFESVISTAYYPANNPTWTADVLQNYGGTITWVPYTPLKITTQPKSVTVAEGETAKVTVTAQGDGLSYRWYYKNPDDSGYTYTSSFKGNSYYVTMNEARNGRYVLCRVYDQYGNMVQTNTVKLSMTAKTQLAITQQPVSVTVAEGETAKVTVGAVGDGLSYRWYFKNAGDSGYTYTSSFRGNTYSVTMNDARNGRQVLCRIYDKYGNVIQTNTVKLSMTASALRITQQPKSVTVAEGEMAVVTVGAVGDGLTYRWYFKNPGETKYTYTSTYTGNTYKVPMNEARNGRWVLCRVYDKYGNVVQTNTVVLRMS